MPDDQLYAADMPAVLERTRLARDLDGLLMPLFEAVSNAFHSTADRWKDQNQIHGRIDVEVNTDPASEQPIFVVEDNGIGLNDKNYKNFRTPFTGHKLSVNGKGFGRFINFKVFEDCYYSSQFESEELNPSRRDFTFNIYEKPEIKDVTQRARLKLSHGTRVELAKIKPDYASILRASDELDIVERFIKHFLSYFISPESPKIYMKINGNTFDISKYFSDYFKQDHKFKFTKSFNGQDFSFTGHLSRINKTKLFDRHAILFQAADRVIGSGRNIVNKVGQPYFTRDDDTKYVVIASVAGSYFDEYANYERTDMNAPAKEVDDIVNEIVAEIQKLEAEKFEEIKSRQGADLKLALQRSPLLRLGLRGKSIDNYVRTKPNSWTDDEFVQELALLRYRDTKNWHEELEATLTDASAFQKKKLELISKADKDSKEALAEYVVHRRAILDIAEGLRKLNEDGGRPTEDEFHDLIFARNSDSTTTSMKDHNLWMLDERLSFCDYISSDRTLHGSRRQKGDKITDILLYEEGAILKSIDKSTLLIVEFKKPGRLDYKYGDPNKDPFHQVIETVKHIRSKKGFIADDGTNYTIPEGTNILAFIVADINDKLSDIYENHDMRKTWDQVGYFRYHETYDVFIEAIGFEKLIGDAKKRNAAFFDILLNDLTA